MRVCAPVLETDTIKYSVQPGTGFLSDGYFRATKGQQHPAIDLNAVTGGNTDYGNRVRACADGVVIAAGDFPVWGGIVLIHHPELGVWTQYAHLIGIQVKAGQRVTMGQHIGGIGRGQNNRYTAHLHFEVRRSNLPADFWPSSRFPSKAGAEAYIREHYLDPEEWLAKHNALRTLAEVEGASKPAPAKATPTPRHWEPVYDPGTGKPIPKLFISVKQRGSEVRLFKVSDWQLKEEGLI